MIKNIKFLFVAILVAVSVYFVSEFVSFADADKDGITDELDNCPMYSNPDQADFDSDRIGDICDPDDDNDSVSDKEDLFDFEPTEWNDNDSDSIGDNSDSDDDNDGILDSVDFLDFDSQDWADFDFDGVGTNQDSDDDNDGILDIDDGVPILSSEKLATKYLHDIQACAVMNDGTSRLLCYSQFFGNVAKNEKNNSDALELSIVLSKIGTIDDCHFVSHEIGHVSFQENPDVISNLIGMDGTMCRGGFFHGVLASYFHNVEENNLSFPSNYDSICNDLIGSSSYQDCIHGLGHGLVHYFGDDLNSSLQMCHQMSFYQNILCVKGVMMQYTDNVLTRDGITQDVVSNICNESQLEKYDFIECNMSLGTTLSFFTNHNLDEGKKLCELIKNDDSMNQCLDGLMLEIDDSEKYETAPLTEDIREKFQPQLISGSVIDIRSPAIISDFEHLPEIGMIRFSVDSPQYVIMYIPNEFVSSKMLVTVNGDIVSKVDATKNVLGEEITMIRFVPQNEGIVMITSLD